MCGRYLLTNSTKELDYILRKLESTSNITYQTNEIFPSHTVPVILSLDNKLKIALGKWGFSNTYNKGLTINARSETIFEKPMFKDSITNTRCVIPASGFFEWQSITKQEKEKFYFTNGDSSTMYLASTYKIMNNQRQFVILTKEANASMSVIHHRMPVILNSADVPKWIDNNVDITNLIVNSSPNLIHVSVDS